MKITNEMIQDYKNYLITEEKSEVTIEKYIRDIKALQQWLDGRDITKQELLSYKAKLVEEYAPASVNSAIASINGFLAFNNLYETLNKEDSLVKLGSCHQVMQSGRELLEKLEYGIAII